MHKCIPKAVLALSLMLSTTAIEAQVKLNKQVLFKKEIPAGNYSGIAYLGDNLYAVVSDKSISDGFFVFRIDTDSITGKILSAENLGFRSTGLLNRDCEGIAYLPFCETIIMVGEGDNKIIECSTDGRLTGRAIELDVAQSNYGYESLSYNEATSAIWTCTEGSLAIDKQLSDSLGSPVIRMLSFDNDFSSVAQYAYLMDKPRKKNSNARYYAFGVSEILALNDGSLLVLEREIKVPRLLTRSSVRCKLYRTYPSAEFMVNAVDNANGVMSSSQMFMPKKLVAHWKTRINFVSRNFANYEGMCLGPSLIDGSQLIVLISDSQNRHRGLLRDYFRTMVINIDDKDF